MHDTSNQSKENDDVAYSPNKNLYEEENKQYINHSSETSMLQLDVPKPSNGTPDVKKDNKDNQLNNTTNSEKNTFENVQVRPTQNVNMCCIDWGTDTIKVSTQKQAYFSMCYFSEECTSSLTNVIYVEKGVIHLFTVPTGGSDVRVHRHITSGCETNTFDFGVYGVIDIVTVLSLMLGRIKSTTQCDVAGIMVQPYFTKEFCTSLISAGNNINLQVILIPMFLGGITDFYFRDDTKMEDMVLLDFGVLTTTLNWFSISGDTITIEEGKVMNTGNRNLHEIVEKKVREKVERENGCDKAIEETVNKLFMLFSDESSTYTTLFMESKTVEFDNKEVDDMFADYCNSLTTFLKEFIHSKKTSKMNRCVVLGNAFRPFPIKETVSNFFDIVTMFSRDSTTCQGGGMYLSLYLDSLWRKRNIAQVNYSLKSGEELVIQYPNRKHREEQTWETLLFQRGEYLKTRSQYVDINTLIYPKEFYNSNSKSNYEIFMFYYNENKTNFREFLEQKARLRWNNMVNKRRPNYNELTIQLENIKVGDIQALTAFQQNLNK
ncbi:hypothetical protein EIN_307430 [Entamoeba invadens IP1]|uniref:Uncharacterized protein n=1 Tax=Entamoeba invadens IP1 TaxID=370355 RepID=A0A0A1TYW6_ENTIV|nr:hypothetical protein EIN_307430 [Entamoeba invadens IP1]ELP86737.1 hypothetical protein EIN_307430 [Entamoeba invadens IP1]|eukprot:XP_004186083.1 hypothetical protein EIN_307430 [Entamoeba invadens IP1]